MRRRSFLVGTAAAALPSISGCLGEPRMDYLARPLEYDLVQAGELPEPDPGVYWFQGVTEAREALEARRWPDEDAEQEARAFLEETDPITDVLLEIAASGPTRGHNEIAVQYLSYDERAIRGAARVVDDGDGGSEESHPSALVRIGGSEELPNIVDIDITNGWDETEEFVTFRPMEDIPGERPHNSGQDR